MKENGKMIWLMGMAYIPMKVEQNMKAFGLRIYKKVKERNNGLMVLIMKDNIKKVRNLD